MLTVTLLAAFLAVSAGFAVKVTLDRTRIGGARTITGLELVIGTVLCTLVLIPATTWIGFTIARAEAITYNEYWSGLEDKAWADTTVCAKDGSCRHTYECDSYWVTEHYTEQEPYTATESYTKPDGTTGTRTVTKYKTVHKTRQVEKWHSCPYVTHEHTYLVSDTLGDTHNMGDHWFPENPSAHRWTGPGYNDARWGFGAPGLPNVESGQPDLWVQAKARIDSGTPGGVTKVMEYKNYILASQKDIYAKSSSAIDGYKKAGLLPKPVSDTYDHYRADKVYFVGDAPGSDQDWQDALLRFNGTFGSESQGDLHLIVVTDPEVTNPDEYSNAVLAYWQSPELDRNALSKNGYVVVVGSSDGQTVEWARGFSGMPLGNERLSVDVREDLTGTALSPDALIGTPQGKSIDGALGALIFDETNGFERVQMKDFGYLFEQIQPTGTQKFVIGLIGFLLALVVWAIFLAVDVRLPAAWRAALTRRTKDTSDEESGERYEQYRPDTANTQTDTEEWLDRAQRLYRRRRSVENWD